MVRMKKFLQIMCLLIFLALFFSACKKEEVEPEKEVKDTSYMVAVEGSKLYYYVDNENYTIEWYDGEQGKTYTLADHLEADINDYDLVEELVYQDTLWLKLVKDGYVYGFIESDMKYRPVITYYNYYDWQLKISDKKYKFDPVDKIVFFDSFEVKEGTPGFDDYIKENVTDVFVYDQLYVGGYLDDVITFLSGSGVSFTYDSDEGLNYILTKEPSVIHKSLEEIKASNIEEIKPLMEDIGNFYINENKELLDSGQSKNIIQNLNKEVLEKIKEKDLKGLTEHVHEGRGLRLIPLDRKMEDDVILSKPYLENYNERKYKDILYFGENIGQKYLMLMNLDDYWENYVYPVEYTEEMATYNTFNEGAREFLLKESSVAYYRKPIIVRYEYVMKDENGKKTEDFKTMKLVYEEIDGKWYLVAIINNQPSI